MPSFSLPFLLKQVARQEEVVEGVEEEDGEEEVGEVEEGGAGEVVEGEEG